MLCQNCKINDSTIHLYTNLNGKQKQIDLCQNCYKIIKTDPNNSLFKGMTDLNNRDFDPFGDFFNDLNNFRPSSNTPPIPPTQSGGGYGGNGGYGSQNRGSAQTPPPSQEKGLLKEFGINVTEIARRGDIDPVIGRDDEIIRVIEILNRRTKNNPVLIGEPGVGKTAVVEGLAQKIVDGDVPHKLQGKQVIRLDVVSLVQGTGIRGQFEERMQKLMEEIRKREDIILFIDEIHEIVGAGSASDGNMDAGNILKPALARGELQLSVLLPSMNTVSLKRMLPSSVVCSLLKSMNQRWMKQSLFSKGFKRNTKITTTFNIPMLRLKQLQLFPIATSKIASCLTRPLTS